jgi:hypothetical protein
MFSQDENLFSDRKRKGQYDGSLRLAPPFRFPRKRHLRYPAVGEDYAI